MRVFLVDTVHFHEKNFKSLFDFFSREGIELTKNQDINSWTGLYGNYKEKTKEISFYRKKIKRKNANELHTTKFKGYRLWDIVRAESYSFFLPIKRFNDKVSCIDDNSHIQLMHTIDRRTLENLFSTAMWFIDYWIEKLKSMPLQKYALIFSGSQIYNRSLLEILKNHQTTPIVLEHFFTGNEYYFEKRYSPIANSSDIKFFSKQNIEKESFDYDRNRIKAINKIIISNNKNVKNTGLDYELLFDQEKTILVIGQVVNDFSIIETADNYLNSISFYKRFISEAVKKNYNIVFKSHPWEKQKTNVKTPFTRDTLNDWIKQELPEHQRKRVVIRDDFDLDLMFKKVDYVVGLCSQGLLEAAFEGFKPIQFGNAFFGENGFTSDYTDIKAFFEDLDSGDIDGTLDLEEYKKFERFITFSLIDSLVCVHKSGILELKDKLREMPLIPLIEKKTTLNIPHEKGEHIKEITINTSTTRKKIRKLKKDPKSFFKDSKSKTLRNISKLL